eukprot:TRINITY_DN1075_c0_g2_i11.p1 TRINITY_DN1075_c0_g2~~TRINITY_DN1075_c0_g2_i11.p1  ORF type:complete len:150 (-),score=32.38 TRINITY_DN1075_c0_g2_i11:116-565(-)
MCIRDRSTWDNLQSKMSFQPETTDGLSRENLHAARRLNPERTKMRYEKFPVYGAYNYVPIQPQKQDEINEAFREINTIATPTLKQIKNRANLAEIQERLYQKVKPWENELNVCIAQAANTRDSDYCADSFVSKLRQQGVAFIKDVLREY